MKRGFDFLAACGLLLLLALPMVAIGLLLWMREGRPIFYRQQRVGRCGRPFAILKFRTMRPARAGDAAITSGEGDNRITAMGAALRRRRIDEWPQLWNVLRGDMSLVGPRPEVPEFVDLESESWQDILSVRPGITGPDALAFKDEGSLLAGADDPKAFYRSHILPQKVQLQQRYAQEHSLWGDVRILFRTLGALRG
ncbi:MAG: sugar transferase [Flavobacteriales bacterium]|nr:sugar transferase [Flavobacteriales bacterium]